MEKKLNAVELRQKATSIRTGLVQMIYQAKGGHIGGALSSVDVLTALFYGVMNYRPDEPKWALRDRFILSKGHSCEGYYVILADCGFFPRVELDRFMQYGALLMGHPHPKIPGVEAASGSLGHGLSVAVGMALAAKMDGESYRVFCLTGDGELAEGSIWEAAMAAGHYGLDNLVCIIDRNRLQISGPTEKVMGAEPLAARWESFGWRVQEGDGHDHEFLLRELAGAPFMKGKPSLLIAGTVKGKGISFIEGDYRWHHKVPKEQEYEQAMRELS